MSDSSSTVSVRKTWSGIVVDGLPVPSLWLRDACSCAECRDSRSGQRLRSALTLDPATEVDDLRADGDEVQMTFSPDGHTAVYSARWLRANAPGRSAVFDDRSERTRQPWTARDLAGRPPRVPWFQFSTVGPQREDALRELMDLGVLLVDGVPPEPDRVLDVARSFGFVRTTNYGDLFDVRVEQQPDNLAFTDRAIGPHTDNPYREPVPGIQLLHCLSTSASGGQNVLIDGFEVASILREEDPVAFEMLAATPLTFRFDDATTALRASGPTIELNRAGDVRGIRWNERSVEPPQVPPDQVALVYKSMRSFADVLSRPELALHVTLTPGDCIVFDNTRILHARTAFTDGAAERHLQGCYADLDGLASTLAVLER